ncbi:MAG: DUF896 domain-containing protein [Oscillospiraceae bacterium]|nr:DUF896 domain-containing protein [Oscillospiraceae bacterium]
MEKSKIDRINELARKSKSVGLTPEEKEEQAQLRAEYIADFRRSTIEILENTYLQRPDGSKEKLKPKN